jgi:hypothetical protein
MVRAILLCSVFLASCQQERAAPSSVRSTEQVPSVVAPTSGSEAVANDRSTLKVEGSVKAGQTFQLEFSGLIARFRGREFSLYDGTGAPVAVLLSDSSNQPKVGMDWYWSGEDSFTLLNIANIGPTSHLILPAPLEPGEYKLCSFQPRGVCTSVQVVA